MRSWESLTNDSHSFNCARVGRVSVYRNRPNQSRRDQLAEGRAGYRRNQKGAGGTRSQVQAAPGPDGETAKRFAGHPGATAKRKAEPECRTGLDHSRPAQAAGNATFAG